MATSDKDTVGLDVRQAEGDALNQLVLKNGGPSKVAAAAEIAPAYLTQLKQGSRPLNLKIAIALAAALGSAIDDFSPRLARLVRDASPHIKGVNVAAASGVLEPAAVYHIEQQGEWPFETVSRREWMSISRPGRQHLEFMAKGMAIESQGVKQAS